MTGNTIVPPTMTQRIRKKKFSNFKKAEAFQLLNLIDLIPWEFSVSAIAPSAFFQEHLKRLNQQFDLESYEESKKLLIDALCSEAMEPLHQLKIWKGAQLEGEKAAGYVDYLVAERRRYLTTPMLCIIEAKKDDFEQGLAQCLVEMQACQWQNRKVDRDIDVLGIVTNGTSWQFYKLTPAGPLYESPPYSTGDTPMLLGRLRYIFELCEQNLN
jgi:hypothetical protein